MDGVMAFRSDVIGFLVHHHVVKVVVRFLVFTFSWTHTPAALVWVFGARICAPFPDQRLLLLVFLLLR